MYRKIFLSFIFATILFGVTPAMAQYSLGVDAPKVVAVDEVFRVVYTATGKVSDFEAPDLSAFSVLAGPSQSTMSSTQIINGKSTHTYEMSYTYVLQPKGEGKFTISPATVEIEKKKYSSYSVNIEVVKTNTSSSSGTSSGQTAGSSSSSSKISSDDIVLKLILSKKNVVKGEPVTATLKLYTKTNISGFEDVKFPTFNGFWSQEIETPSNIEFVRETLNGEIYSAALLRKYMLLPQQTGAITIEPAELVCQVQVRSSSSRGNSIFDDFFDSYQTIRKRVNTPSMTVNVSPLPAGAPASFTGGVGDFKLDVKMSVDSIKAHEAASMTVTVSGTGNINLIEAPSIKLPPDFEAYDVKRTDKITTGSNGSSGTKSFEYPFIPRSQGDFTIQPVEFTYYNIKQGKYVTLRSNPIGFKVGRGNDNGATVVQNGLNKQTVKSLGDDIRFIATDSHLVKGNRLMVTSATMYIILAVIIAIYFLLCYILSKTIKRRNDVAGTKNRKAKKMAKLRLKKAETFLKGNLYSAFYEEMHKAILGYVSDKFTILVADLTRDRIKEELTAKGNSEEVIARLFAVLDACEYARYAPTTGSEAMEKDYKDALEVISEIES